MNTLHPQLPLLLLPAAVALRRCSSCCRPFAVPLTIAIPQNPEGQGFSPAKDRAGGATALPKAGVKPEGRNDLLL